MAVYWLGSILRFCGWEEVKVNIDAKTDEAWISSYLDWTTGAIKDLSHGQKRKLFLAWPLLEISSGQDGPIQSEHMICFIFPTCGFSHKLISNGIPEQLNGSSKISNGWSCGWSQAQAVDVLVGRAMNIKFWLAYFKIISLTSTLPDKCKFV